MARLGMGNAVDKGFKARVIYEQTMRVSKSPEERPMDVLHQFIKRLEIKKSHILRVEIFEDPPRAVLSLDKHDKTGRKVWPESPTNCLDIAVLPARADEDSVVIHYTINEMCPSHSLDRFRHSLWQRLRKFRAEALIEAGIGKI